MDGDFTGIPILDLSLAQSSVTKPRFLLELRNALVHIGFFYVKHHPIPEQVQQDVMLQSMAFFNLPLHKKLEIETVHSKRFVGYSKMDAERTAAGTDHNESILVSFA